MVASPVPLTTQWDTSNPCNWNSRRLNWSSREETKSKDKKKDKKDLSQEITKVLGRNIETTLSHITMTFPNAKDK